MGSGINQLGHLVAIIAGIASNPVVITGNEGHRAISDKMVKCYSIQHQSGISSFSRIFYYILTQLKISIRIITESKNVDTWLFFIGGDALLMPIVASKLTKKKVIILFASSAEKVSKLGGSRFHSILRLIKDINCHLSTTIVLYSVDLISDYGLLGYVDKIKVAREHFLDFSTYRPLKNISKREKIVGYVGTLSEQKGIKSYLDAIKQVNDHSIQFIICGDGAFKNSVIEATQSYAKDRLSYYGWIPHEEMANIYNRIQLLVLPSSTEGLPNVLIEAMACGTPVLTTQVGAIPNIVKNCITGFTLADSQPSTIARAIQNTINDVHLLESVSINAYEMIKANFCYERTKADWSDILNVDL
jgi:glycosyltransferase involved in cell wall biosynthesis